MSEDSSTLSKNDTCGTVIVKDLFLEKKTVCCLVWTCSNMTTYCDCRTREQHHVGPTYRSVDGAGIAAGTDGTPTAAGLKYGHYVFSTRWAERTARNRVFSYLLTFTCRGTK